MDSLPNEIVSRIFFLAATTDKDSQVGAAASDAEPIVESDVSPCHGMGMVSKRWASLLPVVRISAAADSSSRLEDPDNQNESLPVPVLSAPALSAPALFRTLSRAPNVTSLTLGNDAVDFYDDSFLTSLLSACPKLTGFSLGEPRLTAAPPPFTIGLASLDSFFRAAAPCSLLLELPENFGQLKALTHLSIEYENLFGLPDSLGDLSSLTSLCIDGSFDLQIPSSTTSLRQLRRLELRRFDGELPGGCEALANLEEVTLEEFGMRSLPLTWLETLTRLTLCSCNELTSLPFDHIVRNSTLRYLTLEGLESIPPLHPLSRLTSLQRLKVHCSTNVRAVSNNVDFPVGLFSLPSLSYVSVDGAICDCLVTLPADFSSLGALQRLSIHSCSRLHTLPDSFSSLASLVHLAITKCSKLSTLPDGFGSLTRLARLAITHCNSFTHLLASFPCLPSLRVASFSCCKHLHSLPADMGLMPRLEALHLRGCVALMILPDSLNQARALRHVDVCGTGVAEQGGRADWCGEGVYIRALSR
ncbi:unnamed protein product [Closterium sp. NIES-64]|nr:unnamed protein product [Closterium sp. NIES-64]